MYVTDQQDFTNAAVSCETSLGPLQLLHLLKALEKELGRRGGQRYGPREIDLDLIAYGSASYRFEAAGTVVLQVPHPLVAERRFVLQPLNDLCPKAVLPGLGRISDLLEKTNEQQGDVVRLEHALLPIHGPG
jgi:2-amino-4-hydroxy-6-hydroxymethyldihydropteridine diphosphokinase